ncbi:putative nuclease HARBI1 [Uloborus diversus]|uniref:putative nuclease HARBI1 n=1 Tax=Uloborus diversus TaxID=327109 RepID=UPI0024096B09|nr:putative nuclease HARBI1 [Uloborus diversus]
MLCQELDEYLRPNCNQWTAITTEKKVCDANLKILNVNAKYAGATHDSFIWRRCTLRDKLQDALANDGNSWLLGDSGYPLEPWLMTPVAEPVTNPEDVVYNKKHAQTRNPIERCFGVLKARFRCILKDRVLHYHPVAAARIVNACAVLHNICIEHGIEPPDDIPNEPKRKEKDQSEEEDMLTAVEVRQRLIRLVN